MLEFDRLDRVSRHLWTLLMADLEHGQGTPGLRPRVHVLESIVLLLGFLVTPIMATAKPMNAAVQQRAAEGVIERLLGTYTVEQIRVEMIPWQWMACLNGDGGPLPQSVVEKQAALQ